MTLPWRGTTPEIASEDDSRYETPGGAQNKVDVSQEYLLHLLKLAVTGLSDGSEAATARYSTPYDITYDWLKDRLDAADQRQKRLGFNVKDYGAKGDNTTNDTSSIQSCINAANANGGGLVVLPDGNYKITSELILYPNITLQGFGESSALYPYTTNQNVFKLENSTNTYVNVLIKDIKIRSIANGTTGFKFKKSSMIRFQNIHTAGTEKVFHIDGGENIQISDVFVEGAPENLLAAGRSIFESSDKNAYIAGIDVNNYQIRNIGNGVFSPALGFNRALNTFVSGFHTNDLTYGSVSADGIEFTGDCQGCKVTKSLIIKPKEFGIRIGEEMIGELVSTGGAFTITDVDIDQPVQYGMLLDRGSWISVTGGILTSIGVHGIVIGAQNVSITGAKIITAGNQGIQVSPSVTNFTIMGNYIEGCSSAVLVPAGTSNHYIISNNDVSINNSFKIVDNGTGTDKFINNNLGVI
ncbi:glycosyl hydrolase family 28-related protein [Paenibacillus sp. FSL L8-0493]|uniref:glycosyl hydrolase family 28-related protein n=1 Tax=Paenibacillus sp. FSL L8-0493 TaxID=2975333 RepID=UPI0030FD6175